MSENQKKVYKNQLDILERELQQKGEEEKKYYLDSYYIGSYLNLENIIFKNKWAIIFGLIAGSLCLGVSLLSNITYLIYVLAIYGYTGCEFFNFLKNKKMLKNKYSDLLDIDDTELLNRKSIIDKELNNISIKKNEIYIKVHECKKSIEKLNLFNDYLSEKVDYSSIHFNNNIEEPIDYTENSKKLMKKM